MVHLAANCITKSSWSREYLRLGPGQRRIVAHLDSLQAKMDALKKLQAETAAELGALMPSILDKAFRGEL